MQSAREFFVHELSDVLDAERKLVETLGEQAKEVQNPQLQKGFEMHREQTEGQIERLEQVFEELDEEPEETECKGMAGILAEREAFLQEDPAEELIDVFSTGAAAKVEHYEIAAYESLIQLAQQLGIKNVVRPLQQNLKEEQAMLKKVESISQKMKLSPELIGEEEGEEEEQKTPARGRGRKVA